MARLGHEGTDVTQHMTKLRNECIRRTRRQTIILIPGSVVDQSVSRTVLALLAAERVFASLAVVEESVRSVRTTSEASRCDTVFGMRSHSIRRAKRAGVVGVGPFLSDTVSGMISGDVLGHSGHRIPGLALLADERVFASLAVVEESVRDEWNQTVSGNIRIYYTRHELRS